MGKYAQIVLVLKLLGMTAETEVDTLLRQAFPLAGRMVNAPIKLHLRSLGLVIAAETMTWEADGRVKMTSCAMAWFDQAANSTPKSPPTTVRSASA